MAIITVSNTGGNWNATTAWVGGVVPLSTDSVIFTATSGNLTVNVTSTIVDFDLTSYVGTITFSAALNVSGNWNLGTGGYTQAGTFGIIKTGTGTITSNTTVWSRYFRCQGTMTITLADDFNLTGNLCFQLNGNPDITTLNGFNLYHSGTLTSGATNGLIQGTTKYYYTGTGTTWALGTVVQQINIDFYLNGSGNFNLTGTSTTGLSLGGTKEFKVLTGNLITSSLTALTLAGSRTLDFGGFTINNLKLINASLTITLLSNTIVTTLSSVTSSGVTHTINGFRIDANNITQTFSAASGTALNGTTNINFIGTGTWSNTSTTPIRNNITFKSTCSTTISGNVYYNTGTISDESGCTATTTGSTLNIGASATVSTAFVSWNNVTITTGTQTLNSTLTIGGTLTVGSVGTVTFAGTSGFTCANFTCTTASRVINLATGKTYTVTTALTLTGSGMSLASTSTGAFFTLQVGATQNVSNCSATWINSSGGQTILPTGTYTLTNTTNWGSTSNMLLMFKL